MADINLSKNAVKFPFWQAGKGTVAIHVTGAQPDQPLTPSDGDLISANFGVAGNEPFSFGASETLKLGIKAGTRASLTPLWPTSSQSRRAMLADHGLAEYFNNHPDDLLLTLVLCATADANLAGKFAYSVLQSTATLDLGANAGYEYFRAYPKDKHVREMVEDFFGGLRLPANISVAPLPGEMIAFEYGGYLNFGAGLSIGYELKGAPSFDIGQLQLSEHYQLSVIGKLALAAKLAGYFSVEVRAAETADGQPMTGWARVIVRKKRADQFRIAADLSLDASSDLHGLPGSGDEFLAALLGVKAKNWLNVIDRISQLSDLNTLKKELDGLAKHFMSEWIEKAFDALSKTDFSEFMERVQKVVSSYQNLENSAITLFDRYFDRLNVLTAKLNEFLALTSWDKLKGEEIDSDLWQIVHQLTDGDPLGWMLGQLTKCDPSGNTIAVSSLDELKNRVQKCLDLIQNDAHAEIRKVITLAKDKFQLDAFFNELSQIDSIPKLKAIADQKLGAFVERLTGKAIGLLSNSGLDQTVKRVHQILEEAQKFEGKLYAKFKEAASQSLSFKLHKEYSRASERDALIDVMINLEAPDGKGKALMREAGHGDFQNVLAAYRPDLVKINQGVLTHNVTKQSSFDINIIGWHSGWHYQGLDCVIINTEQQIKAEDKGTLAVFTTIDLTNEKERKRNGERMYTNFLLRFLGESRGILNFDAKNQQYLIDTITGMAASYRLSFDDPHTTLKELRYYVSFAVDFGLAPADAILATLLPLLPPETDDYGQVTAEYEVRYTEAGLRGLFTAPFSEASVRQIMRKIVLTNYLRNKGLRDIGWCYWTQGVYDIWKQKQERFIRELSLVFEPLNASPYPTITSPPNATLDQRQLKVLNTLFYIEDNMVTGLKKLDTLIRSGQQISPHEYENTLGKIGDALKLYDGFDEGDNTIFAVFDQLVKLHTAVSQARASSLRLVSEVGKQKVTKVFIA